MVFCISSNRGLAEFCNPPVEKLDEFEIGFAVEIHNLVATLALTEVAERARFCNHIVRAVFLVLASHLLSSGDLERGWVQWSIGGVERTRWAGEAEGPLSERLTEKYHKTIIYPGTKLWVV